MDNKLTILIIILLSGCTIQAPSYAPILAVGAGAYKAQKIINTDTSNRSTNSVPVKDISIKTTFKQPSTKISQDKFLSSAKIKSEKSIVVAQSPLIATTVVPALYPITRYNNLGVDSQNSAGNPSSYKLSGEKYNILPFSTGYVERGIASWYGNDFHGKKTSNGEIYNMYGMTAAHKTLPIPSYVKVTNLKNKRSVILRINDRGPYHSNRIIDLSYVAAQKLGIYQQGTGLVQVEAIKINKYAFVQLGVFDNPNNARKLQQRIINNSRLQPEIKQVIHQGRVVYKVQIGPLYNNSQVQSLNMKLASLGIHKTRYVIVR